VNACSCAVSDEILNAEEDLARLSRFPDSEEQLAAAMTSANTPHVPRLVYRIMASSMQPTPHCPLTDEVGDGRIQLNRRP
jgi:hypothetical protein